MTKYEPLECHLKSKQSKLVPMKFREIEAVIGESLPASARKHRAWWSNNPSNSVATSAWLNAGYKSADVDIAGEALVFKRKADAPASPDRNPPGGEGNADGTGKRHPIFGCMKGTLTIEPGLDLTAPVAPDWDEAPNGP